MKEIDLICNPDYYFTGIFNVDKDPVLRQFPVI